MKHLFTAQSRITYLLLASLMCPFASINSASSWKAMATGYRPIAEYFGWSMVWSGVTIFSGMSHIVSLSNASNGKTPSYPGLWGTWATPARKGKLNNDPKINYQTNVALSKCSIALAAAFAYHGIPLYRSYKNTGFSKTLFVPSIEVVLGCVVGFLLMKTRLEDDKHFCQYPFVQRSMATLGNVYSYSQIVQRYYTGISFKQAVPYAIGCSLAETALMWGIAKTCFSKKQEDYLS